VDELSIQEFIEEAKEIGLTDYEIQEKINLHNELQAKYPHLIIPISLLLYNVKIDYD